MSDNARAVAKTLFGFEEILAEELTNLGAKNVKAGRRAVYFDANDEIVYKANYFCRLAISILVEVDSFSIRDEKDLYKKTMRIDWPAYFSVEKTFAVKGAVMSEMFSHSQYPNLVVKDAICDVFREETGKRPDIELQSPNIMIDLHINDNNVTISLNTSGTPLFQRGYRKEVGEAPINEVVAAGLIRLAEWDGKRPLYDLMCGSGTIPIEAAMIANEIPAGFARKDFAFRHLIDFDEELWMKVKESGNKLPKKDAVTIIGSDVDGEMINMARRNMKNLPLARNLQFEVKDFNDWEPQDKDGILILNPPYDERLEIENIEDFYADLGNHFKQNMVNWDCWVISSNMEALKMVGLRPTRKIKVFNGNLECSFRKFNIYEGSKKTKFQKAPLTEEEKEKAEKRRLARERVKAREAELKSDKKDS